MMIITVIRFVYISYISLAQIRSYFKWVIHRLLASFIYTFVKFPGSVITERNVYPLA